MAKAYQINRISHFLCYTIEDVCNLYKSQRLHPQTVRKWIKDGLKTIDNRTPQLIRGSDLKRFLGNLNNSRKLDMAFEEFYCLHCKQVHKPYKNTIAVEQNGPFIKAKALCPSTQKIMNKSYKLTDYPELKKFFHPTDAMGLYDSLNPASNTHNLNNPTKGQNESLKQGEFDYGEL